VRLLSLGAKLRGARFSPAPSPTNKSSGDHTTPAVVDGAVRSALSCVLSPEAWFAPQRALTCVCAAAGSLPLAPSLQALLAAALLAALPGLARAARFTINPIQPRSAAGAYFGLTWGAVPRPLTPTSFTVTFPDGVAFAASDRIEIHLPGFGGGYNSFGAKAPDDNVLDGGYLPYQNGITPYTRAGSADSIAATAKCIAGAPPPFMFPCPALDRAPPEVNADAMCFFKPRRSGGVGCKARGAQGARECFSSSGCRNEL
jgi:hypothetical protein